MGERILSPHQRPINKLTKGIKQGRAIAVDMESGTIAAQGYRLLTVMTEASLVQAGAAESLRAARAVGT